MNINCTDECTSSHFVVSIVRNLFQLNDPAANGKCMEPLAQTPNLGKEPAASNCTTLWTSTVQMSAHLILVSIARNLVQLNDPAASTYKANAISIICVLSLFLHARLISQHPITRYSCFWLNHMLICRSSICWACHRTKRNIQTDTVWPWHTYRSPRLIYRRRHQIHLENKLDHMLSVAGVASAVSMIFKPRIRIDGTDG
jgi:hypothetical protein